MTPLFSQETLSTITQQQEVFYLFDKNTFKFCRSVTQADILDHRCIVIPFGESHKTLDTYAYVCEQLVQKQASKQALLVNIGGGMVSDLGGFVAATYKRGIRYLNVPTSLLAMADASLGGKTGIDFKHLKNALGLIYSPEQVFTDPVFLNTLPHRHLLNGWAEMIKHAAINGHEALNIFPDSPPPVSETLNWITLLKNTVEVKTAIVEQDPTEKHLRKILNFGHTLGHALESYALEHEIDLLHGEAIAAGMLIETQAAVLQGLCNSHLLARLTAKITPHYSFEGLNLKAQDLAPYLNHDKKNHLQEVRFALLADAGQPLIDQPLEWSFIEEALARFFS